ncbi:uncharacterized protein N7483_002483 [Penicillium malachiteum]|uniref:uncharacterized protein n=1 Tax=Penicillium malachiteum TaxID=1324776 RepID=UPI002548E778|nr:uncharacterized protein N7483_002483 [Penicillium malachiteum]KAJ5737358.1 hypothetical protein N7483_002483 [Penicillium malachiteum]
MGFPPNLLSLPLEILSMITNLLAAPDLLNLITCSRSSKAIFMGHLWKNHFHLAFIWAAKNEYDDTAAYAMKFRPPNLHAYTEHYAGYEGLIFERPFLSEAAAYGLPKTTSLLLDQGLDVNYIQPKLKQTALLNSLRLDRHKYRIEPKGAKYFEVTKLLLEKGANPELRDEKGNTALALAVKMDSEPWVKLLLKYNADVNSRNDSDETPLALALQFNNYSVIELLISQGADVTAQISFYNSKLPMIAIGKLSARTTSLLIEHGASPYGGYELYRSSLFHAYYSRNLEVLRLILECEPPETEDYSRKAKSDLIEKCRHEIRFARDDKNLMQEMIALLEGD